MSVLVFALLRLIPGDLAAVLAGPYASELDLRQMRASLGLDQPMPAQYLLWLDRVLHGDLGQSYEAGRPVLPLVLTAFQNTFLLAGTSLVLAALTGILLGILSAMRPGSMVDSAAMVAALLGNSMPPFWLGLVLIIVFSQGASWLPSGGMTSLRGNGGVADLISHLVLPSVTLATVSMGVIARVTRAAVLEMASQDYVTTARAKGLAEAVVIRRHIFRNALLPISTVLGIQTGYLLGGAVLVETVFSWPGVGLQLYQAISSRDMPIIMGGVVVVSAAFTLVNLAVDLLYPVIDPRIRRSA